MALQDKLHKNDTIFVFNLGSQQDIVYKKIYGLRSEKNEDHCKSTGAEIRIRTFYSERLKTNKNTTKIINVQSAAYRTNAVNLI